MERRGRAGRAWGWEVERRGRAGRAWDGESKGGRRRGKAEKGRGFVGTKTDMQVSIKTELKISDEVSEGFSALRMNVGEKYKSC